MTHCEYDPGLENHDAYDALVSGSAVCQGYTLAYDYLLKSAGVDDTIISSEALDHAWNLVTVDGQTYYVDCTWDDPANMLSEAYCAHDYFLLSKPVFVNAGTGKHDSTDWLDAAGADAYANASYGASTAYDSAYWRDTITAIPSVGSLWAYVDGSAPGSKAAVKAHDYTASSDVTLADDLDGSWAVWGDPSSYWAGHFTSLASNGDVFIASTPTALYKVDPIAKTKTLLHELTPSELATGCIYGIFYDRSAEKCVYHLSTAVDEAKTGQGTCSLKAAPIDSAGYTAGGGSSGAITPAPDGSDTGGDGDAGDASGTGDTDKEGKPEDPASTPANSDVNDGSGTDGEASSNPPAPLVASGGVYTASGNAYQVTSTSAKMVALSKGKNAKSVTVPASVKLADGNAYQVTKIKAKAFAKSKATTVTLKTAKLAKKSAVKNAFKNSKVKTVKVKVGKASANKKAVKSYKKVLVKAAVGKKVAVK